MKRVAVLIPVFNCEKYVRESLDSILNQTFSDFTIFVVDDCSTDNTVAKIEAIKDNRIQLIKRTENSGIVDTMNIGLDAIGNEFEYIARMDGDDISMPNRFAQQVKFLEENPNIGAVSSWYEMFDQQQGTARFKTSQDDIMARLLVNSPLCHPAVMIRTAVLNANNLRYRNRYKHNEDYDLWYRMKEFTAFAVIPEVLLHYRVSGSNVTIRKKEEKDQMAFDFMREMVLHDFEIEPTQQELYFHLSRWEYVKQFDAEIITAYRNWLDKIISQNEKRHVFPKKAVIELLEELWEKFFYRVVEKDRKLVKHYWSLKKNSSEKMQRKYLLKLRVNKLIGRN